MNYKKIIYLKDFHKTLDAINKATDYIISETTKRIKKIENTVYYLENPFIDSYLNNSKYNGKGKLNIKKLYTHFTKSYNYIISLTNVDVEKDDVILISYYQNLFDYLDKEFLSFKNDKISVSWKYSASFSNADFSGQDIPTVSFVENKFYKNNLETFSSITINSLNKIYTTKENCNLLLNRKSNNTIEIGVTSVSIDDELLYKNKVLRSDLKLKTIETVNLVVSNKNNNLLNIDNCGNYLYSDLSNINGVYVNDEPNEETNIISKQYFLKTCETYRDTNESNINSKYKVKSSLEGIKAVNKEVLSFVIKKAVIDRLDTIILDIIENNGNQMDEISLYYANKIKDYKENYVLSSSYVLNDVTIYKDNCEEINNPMTVEGNVKFCGDIGMESNNKIVLKGDYKKWLRQIIQNKIVR